GTDDVVCHWDQRVRGGRECTLWERVIRYSLARPLGCVVAVGKADVVGNEAALMRAGAVDVIADDAPDEQLEMVIERVTELLEARDREMEREKLHVIGQLAVSVNHEINNPLAGLMGTAELL